jgi:hypothetical protein
MPCCGAEQLRDAELSGQSVCGGDPHRRHHLSAAGAECPGLPDRLLPGGSYQNSCSPFGPANHQLGGLPS